MCFVKSHERGLYLKELISYYFMGFLYFYYSIIVLFLYYFILVLFFIFESLYLKKNISRFIIVKH